MPISVQEDLRSLLGADLPITGLVDQRIYPGQVPDEEDPTPWLYYALPESVPVETLAGIAMVRHQVEFHAMADTYAEAKRVLDAVKDLLDGYVSGRRIILSLWQGTAEEVTDDGYHHVARYQIDAKPETGLVSAGGVFPSAGGSYVINP
jgi:hypothetical protein